MKVIKTYSHLNGLEYLHFHHKTLINEIFDVIEAVKAAECKTKVSKEKTTKGKMLYSPVEMNKLFAKEFQKRSWS